VRRLLAALLLASAAHAAPPHVGLINEAAAKLKAGDRAAALPLLEQAARLRPDYPRVLLNLARTYAALGQPDAALATLERLDRLGVHLNFAGDPALAPLKDLPRFQAVAAHAARSPEPTGTVDAVLVPAATGIIECALRDPASGDWLLADVRQRAIWRRHADESTTKFTDDTDLLDGVFRLAFSPDHRVLWAATSSVGPMTGPDAEDGKRAALVALDPHSGRVTARYPTPADGHPHLLGDFVQSTDGSLYAADSLAPVIWRLAPGATALEAWLRSDDFLNLQGLAFSADGRLLYATDYTNGLWQIDVAARSPTLLTPPDHASFFGLDGLTAVPGGLIAVQNGVNPQRVLLIQPAPPGQPCPTKVLAVGHPAMTDLALGTRDGERFAFVADSGWALFDPPAQPAPSPRAVTIYSIEIE
jgi:sugar lactone lactonase YvrE